MKQFLSMFAAAALVALPMSTPAQAASLIGDTVTCTQTNSLSTFSCSAPSATVGAGQEFGVGAGQSAFSLDFDATSLTISNVSGGIITLGQTIIALNNISNAFTSTSFLNSTISGFDASDVSLSNGLLTLDFRGTSWQASSTASIALATAAAVPEPATWATMLLGFGLIGGIMRRRRSHPVKHQLAIA
nr:PEPxxWA-CTERM sorting domain-containing protein [Sphingopyxis solisilvae]